MVLSNNDRAVPVVSLDRIGETVVHPGVDDKGSISATNQLGFESAHDLPEKSPVPPRRCDQDIEESRCIIILAGSGAGESDELRALLRNAYDRIRGCELLSHFALAEGAPAPLGDLHASCFRANSCPRIWAWGNDLRFHALEG